MFVSPLGSYITEHTQYEHPSAPRYCAQPLQSETQHQPQLPVPQRPPTQLGHSLVPASPYLLEGESVHHTGPPSWDTVWCPPAPTCSRVSLSISLPSFPPPHPLSPV